MAWSPYMVGIRRPLYPVFERSELSTGLGYTTAHVSPGLDDVGMLVVHTYADAQTLPEHSQVPSGAAPQVDHGHPVHDRVVEEVNLGLQIRSDFGWLLRRIQGPVQQTASVDLCVGHNHSA